MSVEVASEDFFVDYAGRLQAVLKAGDWSGVAALATDMREAWVAKRQVFLCGNGGSAGNAIHLANDFIYGVAKQTGGGLKAHALPANSAVITCLANDVGYASIYAEQLAVLGESGDILIVFSGSGNSPNVVAALEQARAMKIKSYAVLGYSGGKCKTLADVAIHFPVDDMQIAEDMQMVVGHMLMQWLYVKRPQAKSL